MANFKQQSMRQSIQLQHNLDMAKTQSKIVKTKQSLHTSDESKASAVLTEEVKRMQQLAGIKEIKVVNPASEEYTPDIVNKILFNNGLEGETEIETGTEKWLDILSDILDKDAYSSDVTPEDEIKIKKFTVALEKMGIEVV